MKRMEKLYPVSLILIVLVLFFMCGTLRAGDGKDNNSVDLQTTKEFLVGSAVKLFAKGYVAVTDIDKIKEANITKLKEMDEEEFSNKYAVVYRDIKGLPEDVKRAYGIDETTNKSSFIAKIQAADKKDLYRVIDSIPDAFIVKHFDRYIGEKGFNAKQIPSKKEVLSFWDNIIKKLGAE